jgi:hypothetical protein
MMYPKGQVSASSTFDTINDTTTTATSTRTQRLLAGDMNRDENAKSLMMLALVFAVLM